MKRLVIILALAAFLCGLFAGCRIYQPMPPEPATSEEGRIISEEEQILKKEVRPVMPYEVEEENPSEE